MEIGDPVFTRPFVSCFFGYLHEAALSPSPVLSRIKPALTPNDRFHHHRIQVMFDCDRAYAVSRGIRARHSRRTSRTDRSERHPADRSRDRRSTGLERALARIGKMDRHLLLLPD